MGFGNIVPPWKDLTNTKITVSSFMDNILKAYRPYRSKWTWVTGHPDYVTHAQSGTWYDTFLERILAIGGNRGSETIGFKYIFDSINSKYPTIRFWGYGDDYLSIVIKYSDDSYVLALNRLKLTQYSGTFYNVKELNIFTSNDTGLFGVWTITSLIYVFEYIY